MAERHTSAASESVQMRRSVHSAALPPEFYDRPAEQVARELLGARVVSEIGGARCAGEIVETEAYVGPHDEASHAHSRFGRTSRNAAMYDSPGLAFRFRSSVTTARKRAAASVSRRSYTGCEC